MAILSRAQSLALGQLARLLFPATLVLAGCLVADKTSVVKVPKWLMALAAVFSIPPYHVGGAWLRYWREGRKAARLGARLPPRWDGKLPGNGDVMMLVAESAATGFLSTRYPAGSYGS